MECVSSAGDVMPPSESFVLSDGPEPDLRQDLKVEDFGRYYHTTMPFLILFKSLIVLTIRYSLKACTLCQMDGLPITTARDGFKRSL